MRTSDEYPNIDEIATIPLTNQDEPRDDFGFKETEKR